MPGQPSGRWMDADGATPEGGIRTRLKAWGRRVLPLPSLLLGSTALAALGHMPHARAQGATTIAGIPMTTVDVIQLAMLVGAMGAALILAVWLIRERGVLAAENTAMRGRLADMHANLSRAEALLNLRDQRIVVWANEHKNRKPEVVGNLALSSGAPDDRATFLAFGRWLSPRSAAQLDQAVSLLRERGTPFDFVAESQLGAPFEVNGRRNAAYSILRVTALGEARLSEARLRAENQRLNADLENMLGLLDALDMPFWVREGDGRLRWVNQAYAKAVEAPSTQGVLAEAKEFLGTQARETIAEEHRKSPVYVGKLSTVVEGDRRQFAVTDYAGTNGSAGIATDMSGTEAIRVEYERTLRSHTDTLDQLTTAVATFDENMRLRFFNQAFAKLWDLDAGYLESAPDNALFLDRLRTEGRIPEQPEWRRWKDNLLASYRAVEPQEHWWHLPDNRTLRVVANPQAKGGVTWVFENVTERMDLESRYNTALRVQGETLDNLAEGVAVFGPDGRGKLFNPAFATLWKLDALEPGTHIATLRAHCDALVAGSSPWSGFVASVTGYDEERRDRNGQCELRDGTALRFAVIHLPNGQVMMTFVDVTDSVNVERALKDKNDALERADQLKNDFVQHVSYELRSPLTNIIGFTDLLSLPTTGPLTERQREYVGHIGTSSTQLITIVNDILDLATVDAGIMELEIAPVRVAETVKAASDLVAERLAEHGIVLKLDLSQAPQSFLGDETRIRQILYNLLSNAANYAPENSAVVIAVQETRDGVAFAVHDNGPGMAPDVLDTVFRRFESHANGGRRRGAGLGLSVVKSFVELHGGTVRIDSSETRGTTVTCFFPAVPRASGHSEAAE